MFRFVVNAGKNIKRKLLANPVEKTCLSQPIRAWFMNVLFVEIFIARIAGRRWKEKSIQWRKKGNFLGDDS